MESASARRPSDGRSAADRLPHRQLITLAAILAGATIVAAQPESAPQSWRIRGRVISVASGDPIRGARVSIADPPRSFQRTAPSVLTGADGTFEMIAATPGPYPLVVAKPGFAKLRADVRPGDVGDLRVVAGAAISGWLVDEAGEPVANSAVIIDRLDPSAAERRAIWSAAAQTDDTGSFRIGGLQAGDHVVGGTPVMYGVISDGQVLSTLNRGRVYFPGTRSLAEAQVISLKPGDEYPGLTIVAPGLRPLPADRVAVAPAADDRATARLRGRIRDHQGRGVSGAMIMLGSIGTPRATPTANSDVSGAFELTIPDAPADTSYRVMAVKPGYAAAGSLVRLNPGETHDRIELTLHRYGSISGRILDESGDPVEGAVVRAVQIRVVNGRRQLVDVPAMTRRTDDLGRYRVFGLPRGRYALRATVGQVVLADAADELPGYGVTYYPGGTAPGDMQFLSIDFSEELTDIDFSLARVKSFRVSGRAVSANGDPVTGGIALIPSHRSNPLMPSQMGARIDAATGAFEFSNVVPGDYVVQVSRNRNGAWNEGEFAYQFVTVVDADVSGLALQTTVGSTIAGHVTWETAGSPPERRVEVAAQPVDLDRSPQIGGPPARALTNADGSFELRSVCGPRRIQLAGVPGGWTLKAVMVDGVDVTDAPLPFGRANQSIANVEIILTDRVSRVAGQVMDAARPAPAGTPVIAFATDRELWYPDSRFIRRVVVTSGGDYSFDGVAPGDYYVAAIAPARDDADWQEPDALEQLTARARRIHVGEGERVSLQIPGPR